MTPDEKRQVADALVTDHQLPIQRACQAVKLSRPAFYKRPRPAMERDREVIEALLAMSERFSRNGFWKLYDRLRRAGKPWNHKRIWRVYRDLGLNLKRKSKPRLYRPRQPMVAPRALNTIWTADFMADALYGGRAFRTFNVLDEGNREALAIEIGFSIPTKRVIRTLEALVALYGQPKALRLDNGPELTSIEFTAWCEDRNIQLLYIQPGEPNQNAFIERFNRSYREGVLDAYVFEQLEHVREATDPWLVDYNQERPHDSLGGVPPNEFMPRPQLPQESSYRLLT